MEAGRQLHEKDLYALYGDYVAAHNTALLAEIYANRGALEEAEEFGKIAKDRLAHVISDMDALEINAFIASRLQRERHDIVGRLRAAEHPASWARIGHALGMTRQSVHEWFNRGFRRPDTPNPTSTQHVRTS